jgi:hypothetical protein
LPDQDGNSLPGIAEALGVENEVRIAKIAWLSRKDMGKAWRHVLNAPRMDITTENAK